ncbi:MAG: M48 family metalloprotease, partial [Endomicrobia bacterium]|nr:M48 family metalloprotease [Endomicrobiia bacterium]
MNNLKTTLLMLGLIMLFVFLGNLIAGKEGMLWAFMIALIMNGIAYWFSDKIVLMMYAAKEVKESELPEVYAILHELVKLYDIPMPKVYIINTPTPNAFATGRDPAHAAVAVTSGILNLLNTKELRGVI